MSTQLPDSITTFFKVSNSSDLSALSQCFAEDAVVRDEGGLHQGHEAIEAWLREAAAKAADSGDVTALSNVIEQGWVAARFEHEGGEGYQRYKRLILEGRWEELMAQLHSVDVDAMLREHRP